MASFFIHKMHGFKNYNTNFYARITRIAFCGEALVKA